MHILYLDDSGSVKNADEQYFVLGGVSVPEGSMRWLTNQLEEVARSVLPECPESVELHAAEIFGGRSGIWAECRDRQKRITMIKNVLHVLDDANPEIALFACAIHKASFPDQDPIERAFEDLSSRFDMFLQRRSAISGSKQWGIIVSDRSSSERNLQSFAASVRRQGNRWGSQNRSICEVPLFTDSTASRLVQLADHIAYAVFRRYNAEDLAYFNCIEGRFDRDPQSGVIHGLAHLETIRRGCTCPACLSRRDSPRANCWS